MGLANEALLEGGLSPFADLEAPLAQSYALCARGTRGSTRRFSQIGDIKMIGTKILSKL